jgi:hypothetical protein
MNEVLTQEIIERKIYIIRGRRVMLDRDLAILYCVPTKRLNEQVKRNIKRFPDDFMFQLTWDEAQSSRSQFATLKKGQNIKYLPYAFTEQGVAMISSVLDSETAIQVNIAIMRVFVKLKEILSTHKELSYKLNELERRIEKHDSEIQSIFEAIRQLIAPPSERPKRRIGFRQE